MKFLIVVVAVFSSIFGLIFAESCIQCNSATDPKCNTNAASLIPQQCSNNSSQCYTKVINKEIHRGCTGDANVPSLEQCHSEMNCQACVGVNNHAGCNNEVYPYHRLYCHICKGNKESDCANESTEGASIVCPNYEEDDRCFIRRTKHDIERGCKSSSGKLCENPSHCLICAGHGCNNLGYKSEEIPLVSGNSASVNGASLIMSLLFFICARIASQ